jgi:hypothetical protein
MNKPTTTHQQDNGTPDEPLGSLGLAAGSASPCPHCGLPMSLSDGWVPSYNDPDNASGAPEAEPYCPTCENLRNYEPMSRSATVMPLNQTGQTRQAQQIK